MNRLFSFGTWDVAPVFALTVIGGAAFALVAAWLFNTVAKRDALRRDNDLKGFVFSVIGVLYAVLLGFVTVGVWERFEQSEVRTYAEASALLTVYRDAAAFSSGIQLRADVRAYTAGIISQDWPDMRAHRQSTRTAGTFEHMIFDALTLRAPDGRRQNIDGNLLGALRDLAADRDARLEMESHGIAPFLWSILFAGALVTIAFACSFGFTDPRLGYAVLATLGATVGLVLFLTIVLDYPFSGSVRVTNAAFIHVMSEYADVDRLEK